MARFLKKGIVFTLICLLILSVIPNYSFAQNITSKSEAIKGYDSVKGYDYIYFGKKGETAVKWRVLSSSGNATEEGNVLNDDKGDKVNNSDAVFLFSEDALAGHFLYDPDVYPYAHQHIYSNSKTKKMCDELASTGSSDLSQATFSQSEISAILKTTKSELGGQFIDHLFYTWKIEDELSEDKFFLPSIAEMTDSEYGFGTGYLEVNDDNRKNTNKASGVSSSSYYLRTTLTLDESGNDTRCCYILGTVGRGRFGSDGTIGNYTVYNIHLSANLNKNAILFASAADSGKSAFSKVEENTTNEWKLTLKDDKDFSDGASIDVTTVAQGKEVTVTHKSLSGLSTNYTNVTAAIYDSEGNLLYYGSVNDDTTATETKITIPEDISNGTYTLKVFGEEWNGDKNTDYAAAPFEKELTIDSNAGNTPEDNPDEKPEEKPANKPASSTTVKVGSTAVIGGQKYKVVSKSAVSLTKAKKGKKVIVPATVKIKGKTFKVSGIGKGALKGNKTKILVVRTKTLTKKSVKGSLKGSKIKTVSVKVGSKKVNKKFVKKYKKIFTKKVVGLKVKVK
jgi:hypothetical protein